MRTKVRHRGKGRTSLRVFLTALLTAVSTGLVAWGASADTFFSAGAGANVPWEGDTGYSVMGSVGTTLFTDFVRLAGEFEYRNSETQLDLSSVSPGLGTIGMSVKTYDLRAIARWVVFPHSITPYVGFGAGFKLVAADDRELKQALADALSIPISTLGETQSYGVSAGFLGLAGLEVPLFNEHFALYAEIRADYTWELTDGVSRVLDNDNLGSFTGMGGVRLRF
jgi:hypothetical protein